MIQNMKSCVKDTNFFLVLRGFRREKKNLKSKISSHVNEVFFFVNIPFKCVLCTSHDQLLNFHNLTAHLNESFVSDVT